MNRFYKLAALVVVLGILIKVLFPTVQSNDEIEKSFWSKKTHTSSTHNIIACGDSRIYRGISSDITAELNEELSFFNLGYAAAGLSESYLDYVVSKFEPNAKNKILIVGISPLSFTQNSQKNESFLSYHDVGKFDVFRYKYLSPYLKHFAPYKPLEFLQGPSDDYIQEFEENGFVASDKLVPDSTFALASYKQKFADQQVTQQDMLQTTKNLLNIAKTDIKVIAFRPPTTGAMRALEDSISGYDEVFVKQQLAGSDIIVLDFNDSDFASYDGSHLSEKSARHLSRLIGKKLVELDLIE